MDTIMGASEVLEELVKIKSFFNILTSKQAYEAMTNHLLSKTNEFSKKAVYSLL